MEAVPVEDNPEPEYDIVRIHYNKEQRADDPNFRPWIIKHGKTMYRVNEYTVVGKAWGIYTPDPNEETHAWLECRAIVKIEADKAWIITE